MVGAAARSLLQILRGPTTYIKAPIITTGYRRPRVSTPHPSCPHLLKDTFRSPAQKRMTRQEDDIIGVTALDETLLPLEQQQD